MTALHREHHAAVAGPCLTAGPIADRVIGVLFVVTVVLSLLGLLTIGL